MLLHLVAVSREQHLHRTIITGERGSRKTSWLKLSFHLLFQKLFFTSLTFFLTYTFSITNTSLLEGQ